MARTISKFTLDKQTHLFPGNGNSQHRHEIARNQIKSNRKVMFVSEFPIQTFKHLGQDESTWQFSCCQMDRAETMVGLKDDHFGCSWLSLSHPAFKKRNFCSFPWGGLIFPSSISRDDSGRQKETRENQPFLIRSWLFQVPGSEHTIIEAKLKP